MNHPTVAVLFGGANSEYEVSLASATSILEHIDRSHYRVLPVGITRDGRWYLYEGPLDRLTSDRWWAEGDLTPAFLSPDRGIHGLVVMRPTGAETLPVDVVFPVLHGRHGEDGAVPALCELAGIPCVGCGMTASALCMDKAFTHALLQEAGIAQARWLTVYPDDLGDFDALEARCRTALGYPMFVKPANAGSSVGISKAVDREGLRRAFAIAFEQDDKVVVEETIVGDEVECAVLGNGHPIASTIGEIVPSNEFYDYNAKYIDGTSELHIPARLPEEVIDAVRAVAVRAFTVLGCRGLSRVDFFVTHGDRRVILNEINTLPGFTTISMYPKLILHGGQSYPQLIDTLIELALEGR